MQKAESLRSTILSKAGLTNADLDKLNMLPLFCGLVGIFTNILTWGAVATLAWVKGTAMYRGQPFEAHLSLTSVQFGGQAQNTLYVCGEATSCSLTSMCELPSQADILYPNSNGKYTTPETWCAARNAGAATLSLLYFSLIPGLIATVTTLIYAAKKIDAVGKLFLKVETAGFTDKTQKMIISGCWAGYWAFMFFAMTSFAATHPDSLGWGGVNFQSSFGLLRFSFFLISISAALLVASFFELWHTDNVAEAWAEFVQTDLLTAKKALYLQLMLQMVLYLLYTIVEVDWAMLLIIICGYYLDAKKRNFMLMYLVIVSTTLLLDVIHIAALPQMDIMTPGEAFGSVIFLFIFLLKFGIIGTIYLYQRQEDAHPTAFAFSNMGDAEDDIAE